MNGKHSGNGVVKSENRKNKYKRYRSEDRRTKNSIRRVKSIVRGFQKKES